MKLKLQGPSLAQTSSKSLGGALVIHIMLCFYNTCKTKYFNDGWLRLEVLMNLPSQFPMSLGGTGMASGLKKKLSQGYIWLGLAGQTYVVISHLLDASCRNSFQDYLYCLCGNLPGIMTQRYKPALLLQHKWILWDPAPAVCGQWKKTRLKINNNRFLREIVPTYQNVKLQIEEGLVFINIWSKKKSFLWQGEYS